MDACDVLIAGGGPAGSSCAWKLLDSGLQVVIMDRQTFPRDKVCGGWITPQVLEELAIKSCEYAVGRVFQPITGFRTSRMGDREIETHYGQPVSYGVRRYEFDNYLLKRCGARFLPGLALQSLERSADHWIINGEIKAPMVVGAGGHFCPVARYAGAKVRNEISIAAQEAEFEMNPQQRERCSIRAEVPELYFCADMKGYGWCFRKQNFLNIGLGRLDPHSLPKHVATFLDFLKKTGKLAFDLAPSILGHAYLLHGKAKRNVVGDGILLIGDAAGLAYSQSGEGIRPAIESGLLAANVIRAAGRKYDRERLETYRNLLASRFARPQKDWATGIGRHLSPALVNVLGRLGLASRWFSRHVVLDRWFLHRDEPALEF